MHNKKKIKYFFAVCGLIALLYPPVNVYYVFPLFSDLLVKSTEVEAIRVANHLSSMVISDDHKFKNSTDIAIATQKIKKRFKLDKINVFSKSGSSIYSTDKMDIGKINTKPFFQEVLANGSPYTKVINKYNKSLEGQMIKVDVVETYVPIMRDEMFIGAFALYFDIAQKQTELNIMVLNSSMITCYLIFIFFIAIAFIITRSDKTSRDKNKGKISSTYQSAFYLLMVMIISLFITESCITLLLTKLPPVSTMTKAIIDSALLVMVVSPVLFHFLFRPLIRHIERRKLAEEELLNAHHRLSIFNKQLKCEISERKKVEEKLKTISLTDELTGLYNRRGFFALLEQKLKVLKRENRKVFILYADIDKFKYINDNFGHKTGDSVLVDTTRILQSTFRDSDIISRLGGDEFVVFPIGNSKSDVDLVVERLQRNIDKYNKANRMEYKLSISIGIAAYDPEDNKSIDTVLARADKRMYVQKRNRHMIFS